MTHSPPKHMMYVEIYIERENNYMLIRQNSWNMYNPHAYIYRQNSCTEGARQYTHILQASSGGNLPNISYTRE